MKKILINVAKYAVIFSIMGWLLWLAFDSIKADSAAEKFSLLTTTWKEGNKFLFLLSGFAAVLSHIIRAQRWRILLEPVGWKPSLWNSFQAVMNGYFINLFIPRGGELSRPVSLNRTEGVPVDKGLGTVVVERIIDLLFLLLCIGAVFVFQISRFTEFFDKVLAKEVEEDQSTPYSSYIFFGAAGIALLSGIYVLIFKRELLQGIAEKAKNFWKGMREGLISIFKMRKRGWFIAHSLLIWILYYLMLYTVLLAFKETSHLGPMDALTIFVVGGIAMAVPLPGGTGTYHFLVPQALFLLCGVADYSGTEPDISKNIIFATIFHGYQTLILILLGGFGLIDISSKAKKRRLKLADQKQNHPAPAAV